MKEEEVKSRRRQSEEVERNAELQIKPPWLPRVLD